MAVIDVDRHILSQIVGIQHNIKLLYAKYEDSWSKIIEVRDKTDALFSHPQKGSKEDFNSLKKQIYRATKNASKYMDKISGLIYQQEALLMHLVSEIREVDTGKGKES